MSAPPSRLKAGLVWLLMRLWHRWPRTAEGLARVVTWVWPGFREK